MTEFLDKLGPKERKGSKPRCHWLTHGSSEHVAERLTSLIEPWGRVTSKDRWMPEGFVNTEEAQLHRAPKLLDPEMGKQLQDWWLAVVSGNSKTPNWDIASTCTVSANGRGKPGLLLLESKAHTEELNKEDTGKSLRHPVSENSQRNHLRIGKCIQDANLALTEGTGFSWSLSRDRNYQMSNRFTWSLKLIELGFSVILVYLGFLNATEMDKGKKQRHFADHAEWQSLVKSHSAPLFSEKVWDASWALNGQALIPLIRSIDISYAKILAGREA
ncbi:MAG: hypothetical protein C4522_02940 [Desulfobacteraceae bacterium]|nr:MAG: hypothetical protein C4522_02940 [Desulfobacteraceae bacterium]